MTCEHELNIYDESWIDENIVEVTLECSLCKSKFRGYVKKDEN